MSLRITGGDARGRSIESPLGRDVRPTSSKIRQALFNIMQNRIVGTKFLDLFAGTGLMGIEALSRGVEDLIAVEADRKLAQSIRDSLAKLGYDAEVITGNVEEVLSGLPAYYFDIIFADPPYNSPLAKSTLQLVDRHRLLTSNGWLIIEHAKTADLPTDTLSLRRFDCRNYGKTSISFFHVPEEDEESK